MKKLLLALLLLASPAWGQTGSQKTPSALNTEIGTTGCVLPTCLWPDNTQGQITAFNARQTLLDMTASLSSSLAAQVTATGNGADTTEDTLQTFSLPAGTMDVTGRCIKIEAWGTTANNADNKTVRLYFGVATYTSTTSTFTNMSWYVWSTVCKTGSNTQTSAATGVFANSVPTTSATVPNQADTNPIIIKVTGQAGTANANDIIAAGMLVTRLN